MKPRISYITLGVGDLTRAIRFYAGGFGLSQLQSPAGVAFFEVGGSRLALYPREQLALDAGVSAEGSGFAGVALACNVDSPEEADHLLREVAAAGGRVTRPAGPTSWGGYAGYFVDPDGFLWEVAWNPGSGRSRTPSSRIK
jgi:catechol 2,3-dioxygenase-like lactoylglutathione lyase family enzyme